MAGGSADRFDFQSLIESILDLSYHEMLQSLDAECGRAEASARGRGGPKARADGAYEYSGRIKRVLFWLRHMQPADQGQENAVCRRIAARLIEKGQLLPEAMIPFTQVR